MPDKAWKQRERDVADFFHGQRNPLSGRSSKHTAADVIHDRLFIECKLRGKHSAVSLWDEVTAPAEKEGKTPVACLCEKSWPEFLIIVPNEDLSNL